MRAAGFSAVLLAPLPGQSTVLIKGRMLLRFIYAHMEASLLEEQKGKAVKACGELNRSHNKMRPQSFGKLPMNPFFITYSQMLLVWSVFIHLQNRSQRSPTHLKHASNVYPNEFYNSI